MQDYKVLLDGLRQLKSGKVPDRMDGICANIDLILRSRNADRYIWSEVYDRVVRDWEYFSGDEYYPVPSPDNRFSHEQYFDRCHNLWDRRSKYGKMRYKFLDYMIDKVQDLIEDVDPN